VENETDVKFQPHSQRIKVGKSYYQDQSAAIIYADKFFVSFHFYVDANLFLSSVRLRK
jgi:hypothetical protein